MSGKATATEIENSWTWSDMLKCVLFLDMEAIQIWKDSQDPKENRSAEFVLSK